MACSTFNLRDWYFLKWQQRTTLSVTVCSKVKITHQLRLTHKRRHCLEKQGILPKRFWGSSLCNLRYSSDGSNADQKNPLISGWENTHPAWDMETRASMWGWQRSNISSACKGVNLILMQWNTHKITQSHPAESLLCSTLHFKLCGLEHIPLVKQDFFPNADLHL